ncbi:MAG: IS200/IS605 family transposase [Planctomycetes bacterium]|nr:IS200/IS605 family transposase [Planctomycetota bacterium]
MQPIDAPFHSGNMRYAYQLHYHLGFRTRRRVPALRASDRKNALHAILSGVCERSDYHVLQAEIDDRWVRLLVSLKPADAPAKAVQTIKANGSRLMFETFPEMEQEIGRRSLWSRGYYLRGVGDVPNRIVLDYVARQKERHEGELRNSYHLAEHVHPDPQSFLDLRPFSHCVAEYNCHFVCCPVGHVGAVEQPHAAALVEYVCRIAQAREIELIRLAVLSDHVHCFAALRPHQSPEWLALTLMNNTSYWFRKNNPGVFKVWDVPGFWTCSGFLRTAGAATTNQVRHHLRSLSAD